VAGEQNRLVPVGPDHFVDTFPTQEPLIERRDDRVLLRRDPTVHTDDGRHASSPAEDVVGLQVISTGPPIASERRSANGSPRRAAGLPSVRTDARLTAPYTHHRMADDTTRKSDY